MDDARSMKLLLYYVALDADIIENDMVMAQLIGDRTKGEKVLAKELA